MIRARSAHATAHESSERPPAGNFELSPRYIQEVRQGPSNPDKIPGHAGDFAPTSSDSPRPFPTPFWGSKRSKHGAPPDSAPEHLRQIQGGRRRCSVRPYAEKPSPKSVRARHCKRSVAPMSTPEAFNAPPEPWLPKRAVAAHYSTSIRTVERWLHAGCPSRLIGGMRRLRLSEAEAFLNEQASASGEGGR